MEEKTGLVDFLGIYRETVPGFSETFFGDCRIAEVQHEDYGDRLRQMGFVHRVAFG